MKTQIYDPWQVASEVIGNRLCLNPANVKKVLFKLDSTPAKAFIKATTMAELRLEDFLEMVLKEV